MMQTLVHGTIIKQAALSEAVHTPQLLHQRPHLRHWLRAWQLQRRLALHAGPPQQRQEHLGRRGAGGGEQEG